MRRLDRNANCAPNATRALPSSTTNRVPRRSETRLEDLTNEADTVEICVRLVVDYDRPMVRSFLVLASLSSIARADAVAYSCGGASNITVSTKDGACVGFTARDASGKQISKGTLAPAGSGAFFATPDGHSVVFLQSSPMGVSATTDGVVVFHDGNVVARYTIRDLLVRPELVTHSVSHVHWVLATSKPELGKTFELTTSSLRKYSFDVATGKQLVADDADEWKKCEVIAYDGRGVHVHGSTATIDEPAIAKGNVKGKLDFAIGKGVALRDRESGITLCLNKQGASWVATSKIDVMYNSLPTN
jgi:hypothetical protein